MGYLQPGKSSLDGPGASSPNLLTFFFYQREFPPALMLRQNLIFKMHLRKPEEDIFVHSFRYSRTACVSRACLIEWRKKDSMKNVKKVLAAALLYSCAFVVIARAADHNAPATPGTPTGSSSAAPATPMPASALFDRLGQEPDVVYLIANSSVVFGPDPHGRSEEVPFIGPVTVPKWPMQGY